MKNKKIVMVSSAGGHFSELQKLNRIYEEYNCITVCEYTKQTSNKKIDYYLTYGTRASKMGYLKVLASNTKNAVKILLKEKPEYLISTGAHSCVPFFYIAKLLRIKTIYIESYAKITKTSLTYKLIKPCTTLTLVQHEEMLKVYSKAKYIGGVY